MNNLQISSCTFLEQPYPKEFTTKTSLKTARKYIAKHRFDAYDRVRIDRIYSEIKLGAEVLRVSKKQASQTGFTLGMATSACLGAIGFFIASII